MEKLNPMTGHGICTVPIYGPQSVKIITGTNKIVFFNIYDSLRVEFYNESHNYCSDMLLQGVSKICLCSPTWQHKIGSDDLYIKAGYNNEHMKYYLKEVTQNDNASYLCVLKPTEHWNTNYDALLEKPYNIHHAMRTLFYDDHDEYFACRGIKHY